MGRWGSVDMPKNKFKINKIQTFTVVDRRAEPWIRRSSCAAAGRHPGIDTALTHTNTPHLAMRAKCVQSAPNPNECVTGYWSSRAPGRAHGAARACGPLQVLICCVLYYLIRLINV